MRVKITLRCNECKQLKKVVWPTPQKVAKNTGTVLLCSLVIGACIWVFDGVAGLFIKTLLGFFA